MMLRHAVANIRPFERKRVAELVRQARQSARDYERATSDNVVIFVMRHKDTSLFAVHILTVGSLGSYETIGRIYG